MEKTVYKNGVLILRDRVAHGMALLVHGGSIADIVPEDTGLSADYRVVDLGGNYLAPGFVELHTHGAGGADFMDADPESFLTAARVHALHGTTALCPTTLSGEFDELHTMLRTGVMPETYEDISYPVSVLEALYLSYKTGREIAVL